MSTVIAINGSTVGTPWPCVPTHMTAFTKGGIPSLTLLRRGGVIVPLPDPWLGKQVTATINGSLYFSGDVVSVNYEYNERYGWVHAYQCLGLRNRMDWFPHTDSNTGIDLTMFNLQPEDANYQAARAGRTLGQILTTVLQMTTDANALSSNGIGNYTGLPSAPALPTVTATDLAALTLIPPSPVYFRGEKLGGSIESILQSWAPNIVFWVDPSGNMRFLDMRTFTAHTFTLGTDPIDPPVFSRSIADSFTRVVVRGQPYVESQLLTLSNGGIAEDFAWGAYTSNAAAKSAWTPADFTQPGNSNASDVGTCTCPSTTTVTVTSSNSSQAWISDYWDQTSTGRGGVIYLAYSVGTGITQYVSRRIVANTAMSAGGTSTITVDLPLPITSYDSYAIYGTTSGPSNVWRLYSITNSATAQALALQFPYQVPFVNSSGSAASLVSIPTGSVCWSLTGSPPYIEFPLAFTVNQVTGTITFVSPTYLTANNAAPADVRALLAVNTGANVAICPADVSGTPQYEGTAYSVEGFECTLTVTVDAWRDPGQVAAMLAYASDLLDSGRDTVVEGAVTYYGLYEPAPLMGMAVNVTGNGYTTGWENLTSFSGYPGLPVQEVELEWLSGQDPSYRTSLHCSNRRAALSSEAFMKPDRTGTSIGTSEGTFAVPGIGSPGQFGGGGGDMEILGATNDMQNLTGDSMSGLSGGGQQMQDLGERDANMGNLGQSSQRQYGDTNTGGNLDQYNDMLRQRSQPAESGSGESGGGETPIVGAADAGSMLPESTPPPAIDDAADDAPTVPDSSTDTGDDD